MGMTSRVSDNNMPATPIEAQWPALRRAARTVVVVDMVESVRLIEQDEEGTVRRWQAFVGEVVTSLLPQHGGRLVKSLGDGLMVEFEAVPPAIRCAIDMQQAIQRTHQGQPVPQWIHLRAGVHAATVFVDERDIYGAGVNLAARLATLGGPDDIVVSANVREAIVPGLDVDVEDLGECYLKHVSEPVRAYRLSPPSGIEPFAGGPAAREGMVSGDLRPTLAVLPFREPSNEPSVLGDMLADEAIGAFSRAPDLNVISRLSTMALRPGDHALPDLARRLGFQYVLSGTCRRQDDRFTLLTELAEARTGRVVWADTLHGDVSAVLAGESDAIAMLCGSVQTALLSHELRRSRSLPVASLDSHALLLGAITLLHRNSIADSDRARELLDALVDRLPRHPVPRAWLAKWRVMRAHQGWTADPALAASQAHDDTRRALDLDPENALALTIDGLVHVQFNKELDLGEQRYDQALRVNPNESLAWLLRGVLHAFRGEGALAVHDTRRALMLSPLDPMKYYYDSLAASAAASAGEYDAAIALARRSLRANCMHTSTLRTLAISQSMLGLMDDARVTVNRLLSLEPHFTLSQFRARSPGASSSIGQRFVDALRAAGVPE